MKHIQNYLTLFFFYHIRHWDMNIDVNINYFNVLNFSSIVKKTNTN